MWSVGRVRLGAAIGALGTSLALAVQSELEPGSKKARKDVVFAGVEGGGQSWRVALAVGSASNIVEHQTFKTTTPEETLGKIKTWLDSKDFDSLGVATFGPVDLHKDSSTYGYITTTPKQLWRYADVLGPITKGLSPSIPVAFDTDVNAPAMAEFRHRANKSETSCAYITVGTGVGVGLVINSQCVHGLMHPEGGHLCAPRHPADNTATTNPNTPFAGLSVESMCNSDAIALRAGVAKEELRNVPDDHPVWDQASHYLASLCTNMILLTSPERIVISGGIMNRQIMFPLIRSKVQAMLNSYIDHPRITKDIDSYIVPSVHGDRMGIVGALALAEAAYDEAQ